MRDNFNRGRGRSGGGGRSFGNRSFGDRGDRQMFQATCDKCGKQCEVPFQPTNGKPVFCSDCFRENNGGGERRSEGRRDARPNNFGPRPEGSGQYKEQLDALNRKLDRILKLLEPVAIVASETQKEVKEIKEEVQLTHEEAMPVAKKKRAKKAEEPAEEVQMPVIEAIETPETPEPAGE